MHVHSNTRNGPGDPDVGTRALDSALATREPAALLSVLRSLVQTAASGPGRAAAVGTVVVARLPELCTLVVDGLATPSPDHDNLAALARLLADLVVDHPPDSAALPDLVAALPRRRDVDLAPLAAELTGQLVHHQRSAAAAGTSTDLASLAGYLSDLSIRLSELGRHDEGLEAITEAAAVNRDLAASDPHAYRPALALTLSNLSASLEQCDRLDDALAAAEESTAIRRQLLAEDPDPSPDRRAELATSLGNLSIVLRRVGRGGNALAISQESAAEFRRLVQSGEDTYEADLAIGLNNLSNDLHDSGRVAEALEAAREAVAVRRRLAERLPGAHVAELAAEVMTLANRLDEADERAESVALAQEGATFFRRLHAQQPDAFGPDLAKTLAVLSRKLRRAGRAREALEAAREAASLYRLLSSSDERHRPGLANGLEEVAAAWIDGADGWIDAEAATAAASESVAIRRSMVGQGPDRAKDLAFALVTEGTCFEKRGLLDRRHDAMLQAAYAFRSAAFDSLGNFQMLTIVANDLDGALRAGGRHADADALDADLHAMLLRSATPRDLSAWQKGT